MSTDTATRRILTWIPRTYGSPLGYVVADEFEVLAADVRRAAAASMFPSDLLTYDRYGMTRPTDAGVTLAQRLADDCVAGKARS